MSHNLGEIKVAAKVNLTLNITGKRGNLHTLDMVLCSIDLFDELSFCANDLNVVRISSKSSMRGFDSLRFNAAMQGVASKFIARFGAVGCDITIKKNIPLGAGLGGSSASIAGVVYALETVLNLQKRDKADINKDIEFLLSLGSDVPYMCVGGMARVSGIGEEVEPLEFSPLHFVILASNGGVGSREAYAMYDKIEKDIALDTGKHDVLSAQNERPSAQDKKLSTQVNEQSFEDKKVLEKSEKKSLNLEKLSAWLCNDLESAACMLSEDIMKEKEMLKRAGAVNVVMSGSGSAVIAVCKSRAEAQLILAKSKIICAENNFDGFFALQSATEKKQAIRLCKR